jgi:hypothetical protein
MRSSPLDYLPFDDLWLTLSVALETRDGLLTLAPNDERETILAQLEWTIQEHKRELRRRADMAEEALRRLRDRC